MTLDREHSAAADYEFDPDDAAAADNPGGESSGSRFSNWPANALAWFSALPAVAVAGWLLAALPLVVLHSYRPLPAVLCGLVIAAILCRPALRVANARARDFGAVPWWVVIAILAIVVGFGVLAFATSAHDVLVRRDPGSYSMSAAWLASHGTIEMPTHAASFGGTDPNLVLASQGFYVHGSHIIPQFMTGVPVLMAIGGWFDGVTGVLHTNAIIGAFALLAFAGLVARLVGPKWAPLAVLTLAFVQPELDVMRATYSEPAAQLILLGGLCVVVDALLVGKLHDSRFALAVGGLVMGLVLVVRIDAIADLLPLVPYAGWLAFHRQRVWRSLAVGVGIGLLVGGFDCIFLTLPYAKHVGGSLLEAVGGFVVGIPVTILVVRAGWASRRARDRQHRYWPEALLLLGLLIAAAVGVFLPVTKTKWHVLAAIALAGLVVFCWVVARSVWWGQRHADRTRSPKWPAVAAVVVFVGGLFYFLRPHLMTMRSAAASGGAFYVSQVQRLEGLPQDPTRSYYEDATRWLSWYFGWTTLALALAGAMFLAYQQVKGRRREWLLPLALFLGMTAAVLAIPSITPDHPWADRRFVPVVLPGVIAIAVLLVSELFKRAGERRWNFETVAAVRTVVVVAAAAVIVVPAWWGSKGVFTAQTEQGEVALVRNVCAQLKPGDAVIAFGAAGETVWPGTVRIMCNVGVGYLDGRENAAALQRIGERVQARGGRLIVLVDGTIEGDRAAVPGVVDWPAKPAGFLQTSELGHTLLKRPDHLAKGLRFEVWLGQLNVGG